MELPIVRNREILAFETFLQTSVEYEFISKWKDENKLQIQSAGRGRFTRTYITVLFYLL